MSFENQSLSQKNFGQDKMSVNQSSHFWYRAFTNSFLEIFDKVPALETIILSYTQEVFPSTSLDESSIEFEFETDRYLDLDMRDTHLSLKLQLFKGRLIDTFKTEKTEHNTKSEEDLDEEPQTDLTYVNNLLHSLLSNCEVYLNNELFATPMDYILLKHKYRTNSTRWQ